MPERAAISGQDLIINLESCLRSRAVRIDALHAESTVTLGGRLKFGSDGVRRHWLPRLLTRLLGRLLTGLLTWLLADLVAVLRLTRCRTAWVVLI